VISGQSSSIARRADSTAQPSGLMAADGWRRRCTRLAMNATTSIPYPISASMVISRKVCACKGVREAQRRIHKARPDVCGASSGLVAWVWVVAAEIKPVRNCFRGLSRTASSYLVAFEEQFVGMEKAVGPELARHDWPGLILSNRAWVRSTHGDPICGMDQLRQRAAQLQGTLPFPLHYCAGTWANQM